MTSTEIGTLVIRIPVAFKRRGGRKLIITPEGASGIALAPPAGVDDRWSRQC